MLLFPHPRSRATNGCQRRGCRHSPYFMRFGAGSNNLLGRGQTALLVTRSGRPLGIETDSPLGRETALLVARSDRPLGRGLTALLVSRSGRLLDRGLTALFLIPFQARGLHPNFPLCPRVLYLAMKITHNSCPIARSIKSRLDRRASWHEGFLFWPSSRPRGFLACDSHSTLSVVTLSWNAQFDPGCLF
ncbi:hypothetical protein TorRG33x02_102190 [Trema orientale]|uniref:Uncharacterized protein n=1 Tax=Trema orientale TaxID=63057 RepID=A0A2P5F7U7_TREOI|nr:hypothetical protein TorRG33x02_102190 [Trema orientale]